jgi:S-layer homology domain
VPAILGHEIGDIYANDRNGARYATAGAVSIAPVRAQELCGGVDYPFPYTDVASVGVAFCPGIMEAYVTGVSKGTTPTTFSPGETVTRAQMTTFLQSSLEQGLGRVSRRAALDQWWIPQNPNAMQTIVLGGNPSYCAADGESIWTTSADQYGEVIQVQASTGAVVGAWTGSYNGKGVLVAAGKVFVVGVTSPGGSLYVIDPTQSPGPVTVAANNLGNNPYSIAFDGTNIWTANEGVPGSVSIITPQSPYTMTTVTTGFNSPAGILYDGANIWVTDYGAGTLLRLDKEANILQTVTVGSGPIQPVFDGANIWVPNYTGQSISVVQASTGNVVATIKYDASNQLSGPYGASFDGERVLVTTAIGSFGSITLFKAADLSFIANVSTGDGTQPAAPCSDGISFWVPDGTYNLLRF